MPVALGYRNLPVGVCNVSGESEGADPSSLTHSSLEVCSDWTTFLVTDPGSGVHFNLVGSVEQSSGRYDPTGLVLAIRTEKGNRKVWESRAGFFFSPP